MTFFNKFDTAVFKFDNREWILEDLTKRVINDPEKFFNNVLIEDYYIRSGLRPDEAAFYIYGNVNYYWTFFVLNNMTMNEWPMDDYELRDWYERKYTKFELEKTYDYVNDNDEPVSPYSTYSFETVDGDEVLYHFNRGEGFKSSSPSFEFTESSHRRRTLRDYLEESNEQRRNIKIVKPDNIEAFVEDFRDKLRNSIDL